MIRFSKVAVVVALAAALVLLVAACGGASNTADPKAAPSGGSSGSVSFAKDVLPIFQKNCTRCHGGGSPRQGMSLETYAGVMKGSVNGPVVVAGNPDNSTLYKLVKGGIMPQGGPKLADADIQKINDWIKAGAANN